MAKENENQIAVKKRLIYAEDLFEHVDVTVFHFGGRSGGKTMAMYEQLFRKRVEMAPTIDAVEVVRCKECKRASKSKTRLGLNWCNRFGNIMRDCDFCSFGERRPDHGR